MTKFNFGIAWKDLTADEKNAWEQKVTKTAKQEQVKFGCVFVKDAEVEWNQKHKVTVRKQISAEYKELLKHVTSVEEYEKLWNECAVKMEAIGF